MSFSTAQKSIDWIFGNVPPDMEEVEISFIGGEPLLRFDLLKSVFEYTCDKKPKNKFIFFASTNGTLLTQEIKDWFSQHKKDFYLGLSLDGTRETHNHNRSNSFDKIDIKFFRDNWPEQTVKMTLSEHSLHNFAENIKYIHSLGFEIAGVNLCEGNFDWSDEKYVNILIPQLKELAEFYASNEDLPLNQMFGKNLAFCEAKDKSRKKWCGIGNGTTFFDTDGKMYPCNYATSMTFPKSDLDKILETDFANDENFIDEECFENCYIYPICNTCAGSNYSANKNFKTRDKRKCKIQKLIALFIADLQTKLIIKNPKKYDATKLYHTIEAIKKIRELYLEEFLFRQKKLAP
jgi:radical SAM protein with 4Fe4S-binding SPASM domain